VALGAEEVSGGGGGDALRTARSAQRYDTAVHCDTRAGLRPAPTDGNSCAAVICCMGGIFVRLEFVGGAWRGSAE